jgi:ferredoxin-NADP reductase
MLRTLANVGPEANVRWIHAARAKVDILFSTELEELQQRMPNLEVSVMLSEAEPGWLGLRGLISRRHISAVIPDFQVRVVYCCGRAGFMNSARRIHAADGARHTVLHMELFAPVLEVTLPDTVVVKGETYKVAIDGKTFSVKAGETILMAASRQQVVVSTGGSEPLQARVS